MFDGTGSANPFKGPDHCALFGLLLAFITTMAALVACAQAGDVFVGIIVSLGKTPRIKKTQQRLF
ncbi:MAG: hypothetical protein U5K27_00240 [Desulfotignum sp.]|nr:hypothetical protein [Desulfotignum sp.]